MPGAAAALLRTTTGEIGLLLLSALLFALAHPNLLSRWGFGPLAFVALAPVFLVLRRVGWLRVVLYGVLYGYVSYALYNYWLATFHPLAIIIVPVVYMGYLLILFLLLKLADQLFPRYGYLVQILVWVGYELVKSLGFLGYSYGILGYTQYLWTDFIQIAGVTGVWGVSMLVIAPSALLARWALEALGRTLGPVAARAAGAILGAAPDSRSLCGAAAGRQPGVRGDGARRLPGRPPVARRPGAAEYRSLARGILRLRTLAGDPVAAQ